MTIHSRTLYLLVLSALGGLTLLALLVHGERPPVAESAGPYSVGNSAVRIEVAQQGPCQPGALYTGNTLAATTLVNPANPAQLRFTAPVNDVPGFRGCIAPRNGPQQLVIDNELFHYANVHTSTSPTMHVNNSTQSFNLNVDNCYGFSPSDLIYVSMERMQWDTGICDGEGGAQDYLHIVARPDAVDYAHGPNAFVRVHGLLLIMRRHEADPTDPGKWMPKFLDYVGGGLAKPPLSDAIAYTPAVTHTAGAPAHSPATYAVCSDLLTQEVVSGGDDIVVGRTRCALVLEPGYDASGCDSDPDDCYWPTDTPPTATTLRRPVFNLKESWNITAQESPPAYDELRGTIDDDGTGAVTFSNLPVNATDTCKLFFTLSDTELLYLSSDMTIPGIKNFIPGSSGAGTLTVKYFVVPPGTPQPCGGTNSLAIPSTLSFTKLPNTGVGSDTDGDSCEDVKELSGTVNTSGVLTGQGAGGWRDPLNRYDYLNPTGDGLNRVDDILAIVNQYFVDDPPNNPDLTSLTDRTALKPEAWNLGKPNGQQRVDDILAAVKQYFHDC